MTRRNISIPEALSARLDRLRDRINVSRVCAAALESELDRIEGQAGMTQVDEGRVERIVARLQAQQGEAERWYARGRADGERWVEEEAALPQLRAVEELFSGLEDVTLDAFDADDLQGWYGELPAECRTGELDAELADTDAVGRGAYVLGWCTGFRSLWRAARARL